MTMQNPERIVTKKDLKDFYDGIYPYLGGGGGSIQVSEMPEASQSNEGKIVEYIGDTTAAYTNGYFYVCVGDGQDPETFSWEQKNVQPSGGGGSVSMSDISDVEFDSLADGQILVWDATEGKWINDYEISGDAPYVYVTTATLPTTVGSESSVIAYQNIKQIGTEDTPTIDDFILDKTLIADSAGTIGVVTKSAGIGIQAKTVTVAIADYSVVSNKPQIGGVTLIGNKSASDLGLAESSKAYQMTDTVTGTIDFTAVMPFCDVAEPKTKKQTTLEAIKNKLKTYFDTVYSTVKSYADLTNKPSINSVTLSGNKTSSDLSLQDTIQYSTMPTASADLLNKVVQFTGTTTSSYIHGYYYECVSDGQAEPVYSWTNVSVQGSGGSSGDVVPQYISMPTPGSAYSNIIAQYAGATDTTYTNGYFYKCEQENSTWMWKEVSVQEGGKDNVTVKKSTLTAGNTTVTFVGIPTVGDYLIDFFNTLGVNYSNIDTGTAGQVTLTYPVQVANMDVFCQVTKVELVDGRTVLPTDSIQLWLSCAGITNEPYTTLSQVLSDISTLQSLINSENAVDYMVRSKTWASDICSNQTAMSYIGDNDYCANTLLADSTWSSNILSSTYYDSVLKPLVPVMTSNTTPSGEASASSTYGSFSAYKAFRNQAYSDGWAAESNTATLTYDFSEDVKAYKVRVYSNRTGSFNFMLSNFSISASDDNSTYTTLVANQSYTNATDTTIDISSPASYRYYRLSGQGNDAYVGIQLLQFYGR